MRALLVTAVALAVSAIALPATASAANLRAGVGKADITPQTGYYLGGWTRADRVAGGQHTRLQSRALVLERNGRKVALVQIDLFMVPGGMVKQLGDDLRSRGFSEQNILISASHTHSGPGGYANFPTLNTAAPSLQTATDPFSFFGLLNPAPADRQLYTFLLKQISAAIQRADADLGPAAAGWGSSRLLGITRNRSLEGHLANHGFDLEYGQGTESQDPGGYEHTIDPDVNVLRVDKFVRRRVRGKRRRVRVPIGGWSTFADHGTVTKSTFQFYNADHHASAMRVFEDRIRKSAKVPGGQQIVNVYGNSNEGDQSAGLDRSGPAASDYVGRVEANAMLRAWRAARKGMSRAPELDLRWTRVCFCGQEVEGGTVADESQVGIPFLTGSEEERGPLFDVTQEHFEGRRAPAGMDPHGRKIFPPGAGGGVPNGVPLMAVRVGRRMIVSLPGEGTKEVGERIRVAAGAAIAGSGVEKVVLSGLANEFVLYFTTPEEYEKQHYEGGNTHFGRLSSVLMRNEIAKLAGSLARGQAAPAPYPFDPTNGVIPDGAPYSSGAAGGTATGQPASAYARLQHATFSWKGGPKGLDRPVDRAFVTAQRRKGKRRVRADSDLGLAMLWTVTDDGLHSVKWEIPLDAKPGRYRLLVTAKRYRLASRPFRVGVTRALKVFGVPARRGRVAVGLQYPGARRDIDLTHRPQYSRGGVVRFRVGRRIVRVKRKKGRFFSVRAPRGRSVTVPAGAGRDRFGNRNGAALRLR
ncbi:MAG: neutral/alkaline non-lysosomal ceramidase N-terminal domain-containing protein [Actinomycetota bacterium]